METIEFRIKPFYFRIVFAFFAILTSLLGMIVYGTIFGVLHPLTLIAPIGGLLIFWITIMLVLLLPYRRDWRSVLDAFLELRETWKLLWGLTWVILRRMILWFIPVFVLSVFAIAGVFTLSGNVLFSAGLGISVTWAFLASLIIPDLFDETSTKKGRFVLKRERPLRWDVEELPVPCSECGTMNNTDEEICILCGASLTSEINNGKKHE